MKAVLYSLVVGSLMYAQVCIHPDIAFIVGLLRMYLKDPNQSHWKMAKKVLRYLQGTKDHMLTYRCTCRTPFLARPVLADPNRV